MPNFLAKGWKKIMRNIRELIDEVEELTIPEAFQLVKALKDRFGSTWPPTVITSVTTVDGEVKADEGTGTYMVGGPPATFTIEPTAAPGTYSSLKWVQTSPDGTATPTSLAADTRKIPVDVGALENGDYTFHALTVDADGKVQTPESPRIKVRVKNDEAKVVDIDIDEPQEVNPDSGAPQGTLVVNAYTPQRAFPVITGMRFEVKRYQAEAWKSVGEIDVATAVFLPEQECREWTVELDTTTLEDTITADSPAARAASLDPLPYMVRAVAIAEGTEIVSSEDVIETFSVDNIDDVGPIGPTEITGVAIPSGMIPLDAIQTYDSSRVADGSTAVFTIKPTAASDTYSSVRLMRTDQNGIETACEGMIVTVDVVDVDVNSESPSISRSANTETKLDNTKIKFDISTLEDGPYAFHALAVDEFGNVQTDTSPEINFFVKEVPLPPKPTEDEDRLNPVRDSARRKRQLRQQLRYSPKKDYQSRERRVRTTKGTIDPQTQLRARYTNEAHHMQCQMCSEEMPFKKRNSNEDYFEAVEVFQKEHFPKEHEAQYLALCPECAAKYKEFVKRSTSARETLYALLKTSEEPEVRLESHGHVIRLWFEDKHWQDLRTVIEYYENEDNAKDSTD